MRSLCLAAGLLAGIAGAAPSGEDLDRRTAAVAEELRCLVCQNQTIADSHAELAVDLRRQVREQLAQGRTRDQVIAFMTERYGDFVVYRPPLRASTVLLWFGPALLLVAGFAMLYRHLRAGPGREDVADARRADAARLLDDEEAAP